MADQLAIYNVALAHLGERRLASLAEPREPARVLNDEWTAAVNGCLQMAPWSFATRTQQVNAAGGGAGPFANRLPKPADWLRTADIAADGALTVPLDGYLEEGMFWFAAPATIWVRFVSNDPGYGYNVGGWHQPFADLVALALAARACRRLTGAGDMLGDLIKLREQAGQEALTYEERTAARQYPGMTGPGETRLQVYNDALAHLGRARISSLTSAEDAVRALNDQWPSAVRWCLEAAPWGFATRTGAFYGDAGFAPRAGYLYAASKPDDWVRSVNVSLDSDLLQPIDYVEEGTHWFSPTPILVVRYVSSDPAIGGNPGRWPSHFCDLIALRLAEKSCGRLSDPKLLEGLTGQRQTAEAQARAIEAAAIGRIYPHDQASLTRLEVYNAATGHLGLARIAAISEVGEVTRSFNEQWPVVVRWCLQQAPWQFAVAELTIEATGTTPPNTLTSAFPQPADWVMTLDAAKDAQFTVPVYDLVEETGLWYANTDSLNIRYVSSAPDRGFAVALWPPAFCDLVAARLASMCAGRLGVAIDGLADKVTAAREAAVGIEMTRQQRSFPEDALGATVLRVFNLALAHLGKPRLAALTEMHQTMRLLTDAWATEVRWALEQGPWNFAIRAIMIGPFAASGPTFGYRNGFKKPDDWLQTVLVSEFEDMRSGATRYADETGWWFSDAPGLFVRYVSTGANYGLNLPRWPAAFVDLVAARMAEKIAPRLDASGARLAGIVALRQDAMKTLRATDALNTPPAFPPEGAWVRARRGGWTGGRRFGDGPGGPGIPFTGDSTRSGDSDLPVNSDFVPRISG